MTETPRQRLAALTADVQELLYRGYAPLEVIDQLVDAVDALLADLEEKDFTA